jgi:GT2 family glycosyltransferase
MPVSFSTVIVTRNRPVALSLSLPLHLAQTRLPERLLIVDSSDDLSANRALVEKIAPTTTVRIEHQSAPAGTALQRNIGLAQISSDVVFFPDDDSLVYPNALAHMMHIYDMDTAGMIGGVCATETRNPPAGVLDGIRTAYRMQPKDRLRAQIAPARARLEDWLVPDPMKLVARSLQERLPPCEPWLTEKNAVWVEWMTGFRMSFRTDVIRKVGFNEHLGRYALYEDIDAGLGVLAGGSSLVAAKDAQIYHHKAPENRTTGWQMGVINILNRAYVVLRSGATDEKIRASVGRYALFRIAQFAVGAKSKFGQDRLAGARAAYRILPNLLSSPPHLLDETYLILRQTCLAASK